jgi:deoxyribodipyrimidine photolyase
MMVAMLMFMLRCSHYGRSRSCYPKHIRVGYCSYSSSIQSVERSGDRKETSLLWLSANRLRLRDNLALKRAAELGTDGLAICIVWPFGTVPTRFRKDEITPAQAFGFAAIQSLNDSLVELGQKLWLIPSEVNGQVDYDPVTVIADAVQELQPASVVVDTCLLDQHQNHFSRLRDKSQHLSHVSVLEIVDEGLLIDYSKLPKALGRSRHGGRALRWTTFLGNTLSRKEDLNDKLTWTLDQLPPPLEGFDEMIVSSPIPQIESFPSWAKELLSDWGDASEEEAIRRSNIMCTSRNTDPDQTSQLSEKGSKDSKLSPYLRWGVISPRRASMGGVRTRDLLWRDWSNVCYGLLNPLRNGQPVLEYMDRCNRFSAADLATSEQELFNMWAVGNTGSMMVDAGMRQLWKEGWMPRKVRILAAACLVEGMGLDWRLGRDWFKHTLIDHDPAINELMWQNAGLVGVDPFYNGIAWEAAPSDDEAGYVEKWMNAKLVWPSHLQPFSERLPPTEIVGLAKERRHTLHATGVYKAARIVSNSGVRIAWPGLLQHQGSVKAGEVIGVGLKPLIELKV